MLGISLGFGVSVGAMLGYFAGKVDILGQRLIEIWSSLPFLYTIIIVSSIVVPIYLPGRNLVLQPSFWLLIYILSAFDWMGITYYVRGEFYREKAKDYVAAAISIGASDRSVIFRHILPNALTPVVSFAPFMIVANIAALVALDFLGFGLPFQRPAGRRVDWRGRGESHQLVARLFLPAGGHVCHPVADCFHRRSGPRSLRSQGVFKTAMSSAPNPLPPGRGLRTSFHTEAGIAKAVDGVDLDVFPGEVVGLVGESGSGKSVTALSVLRLIPDPPGHIEGSILFKGRDLLQLSWDEIRAIRGKEISMIFQEPMTSLNPVFTIGTQLSEVILAHERVSKKEAHARAVEMLELVEIAAPAARMNDYPQQFSGGMRQRVMIAMALACNPALLIADEPTTALDVTIQAQILELMLRIKDRRPDAAILLITHNLAVVAETCNRVMVMYGGRVRESRARFRELFRNPLHFRIRAAFLARFPTIEGDKHAQLSAIPGSVPSIPGAPARLQI